MDPQPPSDSDRREQLLQAHPLVGAFINRESDMDSWLTAISEGSRNTSLEISDKWGQNWRYLSLLSYYYLGDDLEFLNLSYTDQEVLPIMTALFCIGYEMEYPDRKLFENDIVRSLLEREFFDEEITETIGTSGSLEYPRIHQAITMIGMALFNGAQLRLDDPEEQADLTTPPSGSGPLIDFTAGLDLDSVLGKND